MIMGKKFKINGTTLAIAGVVGLGIYGYTKGWFSGLFGHKPAGTPTGGYTSGYGTGGGGMMINLSPDMFKGAPTTKATPVSTPTAGQAPTSQPTVTATPTAQTGFGGRQVAPDVLPGEYILRGALPGANQFHYAVARHSANWWENLGTPAPATPTVDLSKIHLGPPAWAGHSGIPAPGTQPTVDLSKIHLGPPAWAGQSGLPAQDHAVATGAIVDTSPTEHSTNMASTPRDVVINKQKATNRLYHHGEAFWQNLDVPSV